MMEMCSAGKVVDLMLGRSANQAPKPRLHLRTLVS